MVVDHFRSQYRKDLGDGGGAERGARAGEQAFSFDVHVCSCCDECSRLSFCQ